MVVNRTQQAKSRDRADEIYSEVLGRISSGALKPGDHLNENQLSQEYNVNRAVVKAALTKIINEGIAVKKENRRIYVTTLRQSEKRELTTLRAVIESGAARLAAENRDKTDLAEFHHLIEDHTHFVKRKYWHGVYEVEKRFHLHIVESSKNADLLHIYDQIKAKIHLTIKGDVERTQLTKTIPDHKSIVDAIENQNGSAASTVTWDHIFGKQLIE